MIVFDKTILGEHGFDLQETDDGFVLYPTGTMSEFATDHLNNASVVLGLDAGDTERLFGLAVELSCWSALRAATEAARKVPVDAGGYRPRLDRTKKAR